MNNAERGAVRNVERDRNERTNAAWFKGSSEDNERNVSASSFRSRGMDILPGDCFWDFRPINPETEPRCLLIASVWTLQRFAEIFGRQAAAKVVMCFVCTVTLINVNTTIYEHDDVSVINNIVINIIS